MEEEEEEVVEVVEVAVEVCFESNINKRGCLLIYSIRNGSLIEQKLHGPMVT